jgi:hypothetical protein
LVDVLLTDYYGPAERDRFLAGVRAVNVRAIREQGAPYLRCTRRQQLALLAALDAETYAPKEAPTKVESQGWFFRRMKELTLLGYYTSDLGAATELPANPMGSYQADVPYRRIGHGWA